MTTRSAPTPYPRTMRAAVARDYGPPEAITLETVPTPRPSPGHVPVEVDVAAVNHVDALVRSGVYRPGTIPPFIIGRDLVGRVAQDVGVWRRGTRVWTNSMGIWGRQGACAEYVAVPQERLYPLPADVDPVRAAAVLHTATTAWLGLTRAARARRGESIVVLGAGGGVGTSVVQVAGHLGLDITVVDRAENREWCRAQAPMTFVERGSSAAERLTGTPNFDLCWDSRGSVDAMRWVSALRLRGRLVLTAGPESVGEINFGDVYMRDREVIGFAVSNATVEELRDAATAVNSGLATGWLASRISAILPLEEASRAHELLSAPIRDPGRILIDLRRPAS